MTEHRPTPPPPDPDRPGADTDKKPLDLSLTQLVGGALAAMTAAYLGSRLSVAGTVIGAAIASIIAGIGGALYTASLRHTRDKVKSVWTGRVNDTPTAVIVTSAGAPGAEETAAVAEAPALGARDGGVPVWRTGRFWKRIAIGALATFALAAGAITGLELVSGQSISGGQGTTVERVRQPQADPASDKPSESPSDEPSESPSDEPTESPSDEPSQQPTEEPSAPTEEPTVSTQAPSAGASQPAGSGPTPAADGDRPATDDAPAADQDAADSATGPG